MNSNLIKRLLAYRANPQLAKPLTDEEITQALVDMFTLFQTVNKGIESGKLKGDDGYTPREGVDYLGLNAAMTVLENIAEDAGVKTDSALAELKKHVDTRLSALRDGKDAIITDEMIEEAARRASLLIEMPDFSSLITAEPSAIRNALELLTGDERIDIKAVRGIDEKVEELRKEIQNIAITKGSGGGLGRRQVIDLINKYGGSGGVSDGDKGDITVSGSGTVWSIAPDTVGQTELATTGTPDGTKFLRDDMSWQTIPGGGDMLKSTYDTDDDGVVEQADAITGQGALATQDTVGTTQIDNDAVTFDKIQNIATGRVLARSTAGTGSVEDLTLPQFRTLINVEDGADVTDTANVTAAGALMDSEVTNLAAVKAFDPTDYATAAQGATADTALQPTDIASGTITPRTGAINFSGGSDGDVLTVQADGSLAPEAPSGGGGGGGISWNEVTGTTQAAAVDNGYITNNASLVTVTLPSTAAVGKVVRIAGKGAGGWRVAQNASQVIHFLSQDTTTGTGGRLDSNTRYDAVELVCITANTDWVVASSMGNITIT